MNSNRIKEIQQETAYPDSISVQQALLKVWNECEQENVVKNNAVLPLVSNNEVAVCENCRFNNPKNYHDNPQTQQLNIAVVMHWVSVADKLPPKNKIVIGYFPRGDESGAKVATAITYDGIKLRSDFPNSTSHCFEATHWMPLPEPPCAIT